MFTGTLFPKQIPAAEMLCNRRRVLLTWEQGTGKTIIAAAAADRLFEVHKATSCLVLAETGTAWQWADKLQQFTDRRIHLVDRTMTSFRQDPTPQEPNSFVIYPWSLFLRDYDQITKTKWDIVCGDEIQIIKNPKSKTARALKKLNVKIKPQYIWGLTGTTIGTKLEELYSIMYWIDKDFLPGWPFFEDAHIVRDDTTKLITGYKNLKPLHEHLTYRMDRKTHADFAGQMPRLMPPVVHKIPANKEYKDAQKLLLDTLDSMVANLRFDDEGNLAIAPDSRVAKAFHQARQNLCSKEKLDYAERLAREILAENPTNRVVFFSFYKDPLADLQSRFGNGAVRFTGDESSSQKRDNAKRFTESDDVRILLASNAGAAGLDLYTANYVIHLDVPFSWATLDQRTKRITRASSIHGTANVIFLVLQDSIEEFYYQVVYNIGRLAGAVQEGKEDEVVIRSESLRSFVRREDPDIPSIKVTKRTSPRKTKRTPKPNSKRTNRKR